MNRQLTCGAAKICITPPEDLLPNLCGLMNGVYGGIQDELFLRAIAVGNGSEKALFVAFDLDKAPYPARHIAMLAGRTGIAEENIFFFGTHTHNAPLHDKRPYDGPNVMTNKPEHILAGTAAFEGLVEAALLRAVDEAVGGMREARIGFSEGESWIGVKRIQRYDVEAADGTVRSVLGPGADPSVDVDRTLAVVRFEDLQGHPIAFLLNHPVHCCVMHTCPSVDGKLAVSGDLAGGVSRGIEEWMPGSVCVWSSGAAGDINPLMMNEMYHAEPKTGAAVTSRVGAGTQVLLGTLVARQLADAKRVIRGMHCPENAVEIAGAVDWMWTPGQEPTMLPDGTRQVRTGEEVEPYGIRVHLVKLGSLAFCGFSGELYDAYGRRLKVRSPMRKLVLINHDACLMARSGYVFDDETLLGDTQCALPGSRNTRMQAGHVMNGLTETMKKLFERIGVVAEEDKE